MGSSICRSFTSWLALDASCAAGVTLGAIANVGLSMHVLVNGVRLFFDVEGAKLVPDGR